MKSPILPLAILLFFISSCSQETGSSSNEGADVSMHEQMPYADMDGEATHNGGRFQGQQTRTSSDIVWFEQKDQMTGMVSFQFPGPSTWRQKTATQEDPSTMIGPSGFKAFDYAGQTYFHFQDQFMTQSYVQAGMQVKAPVDVETAFAQDILPIARKEGATLLNTYHWAELAEVDRNYIAQLHGAQNFRSHFDTFVAEWKDKEGKPSISIMRYYNRKATISAMTVWGYSVFVMEADPDYYPQAKKEYFHALLNTRPNPAYIAQYNANERAKEQQSWSQHNQRMAANQRAFDASQQAYRTRQQASDIQMQGWQNSQNMQDQGHANYINSINETQVVTDPNNGRSYEVESGANQTWMNGNGEYIQSNDYLYDPNMDPNTNNSNWQDTDDWDN